MLDVGKNLGAKSMYFQTFKSELSVSKRYDFGKNLFVPRLFLTKCRLEVMSWLGRSRDHWDQVGVW